MLFREMKAYCDSRTEHKYSMWEIHRTSEYNRNWYINLPRSFAEVINKDWESRIIKGLTVQRTMPKYGPQQARPDPDEMHRLAEASAPSRPQMFRSCRHSLQEYFETVAKICQRKALL
jgi:hypothetical protein